MSRKPEYEICHLPDGRKNGPFKNLSGQKLDHLTVLMTVGSDERHRSLWKCHCDCGKEVIKDRQYLSQKNKAIKSCGCAYFQDLTGLTFGSWLVLKYQPEDDKHKHFERFWLCRCSCGKEKVVSSYALRSGHSKSCGCSRGHELDPGEAGYNRLKRVYKRGAEERGYAFLLSDDLFKKLVTGNCFYCGEKPNKIISDESKNSIFLYNGIDRIDNKRGYEEDNVVSCCELCNRMKNISGVDNFINHCKRIISYYENKI
jgi:hypothetical protein